MKLQKYPKIIAIIGATSTGKSDLAVNLAKKIGAEIISADSRQIYKGMDIGTGKISKKEMRGVKHHLLSLVDPKKKQFNVAQYKKAADKKIAEIIQRGKIPMLVGGSGFWMDVVLNNQQLPEVTADKKLRRELAKKNASELFETLKKLDNARAQNIDPKNKVRLIRAIEIAKSKKTGTKKDALKTPVNKYDVLRIGLDMPTEKLYKRIEDRLDKRLKRGLIAEVKKLRKNGVTWQKLENFGLEYRFAARYLQGKIRTKEKMRELLLYAIKHFAKRQRTWFKRNKNIFWFDPNKKSTLKNVLNKIAQFSAELK